MIKHYQSKGHTVNVFFHTWNDTWKNNKLKTTNLINPANVQTYEGSTQDVIALYNPTKHCSESYEQVKANEFDKYIAKLKKTRNLKICYDNVNYHNLPSEYNGKYKKVDTKYRNDNLSYFNILKGKSPRYYLNGTTTIPFKEEGTMNLMDSYLSHWYSVHKSIQLKQDYEKENNMTFDCVLLFRFDIQILNGVYPNIKSKNISIPYEMQYGGFQMVNDHWVYGESKTIDVYSRFYQDLEKLLKKLGEKGEPLLSYGFSESTLCYHLLENRVWISFGTGIQYGINRNGKI